MEETVAYRLKLFIDTSGITVSEFADMCGIARPTLSQILTGRNKKISDVLVGQIHRTFPDLSVLWLLFGEGPVKVNALANDHLKIAGKADSLSVVSMNKGNSKIQNSPANDIFSTNIEQHDTSNQKLIDENSEYRRNTGEDFNNSNVNEFNSGDRTDNAYNNQLFTSDLKIIDLQGQIEQMRKNPRKVLQITIYYDDSTFETFIPK